MEEEEGKRSRRGKAKGGHIGRRGRGVEENGEEANKEEWKGEG